MINRKLLKRIRTFFGISWVVLILMGCSGESDTPNEFSANGSDPVEEASKRVATEPSVTEDPPPLIVGEVPGSLIQFEMVLVPRRDEQSPPPFYIGKHEVTWDEFIYWALCRDISEKKAIVEREKTLRPSSPHDSESIYRGWGRAHQPAVGISRLAAEKYCQWLSEATGKTYRLPTDTEWTVAFAMGTADDAAMADVQADAWCEENTFDEDLFDNRVMPIGKRKSNALGIHDMLGNVAEWVTDTGDQRVARGGCFLTPAQELSPDHRLVENQEEWNKNYPNNPKSKWWYVDADFVGFRIVMEP